MSNIIPFGARTPAAMPIPLRKDYAAFIYQAMVKSDLDIQNIESLSEQRWISMSGYLAHLKQNNHLLPLWAELDDRSTENVYPALLQFAFYMRFKHLKGRIYETTPSMEVTANQLCPKDILLNNLDLVTGKPVYFQFAPNSPLTLFLNDNPHDKIIGAYLQYEQTDQGSMLYYLIHAQTNPLINLSGHIALDSFKQTLYDASQLMWPLSIKSSNQNCFEHVMKLWALWSSKQVCEAHYQEHDLIAANDHPTQQRRLEGAYNRTILDTHA